MVLVTGSTAGIGKVTAKCFLQEGETVTINDRKQEKVDRVVNELSNLGKVHGIASDLSKQDETRKLTDAIEQIGELDVLVNNSTFAE